MTYFVNIIDYCVYLIYKMFTCASKLKLTVTCHYGVVCEILCGLNTVFVSLSFFAFPCTNHQHIWYRKGRLTCEISLTKILFAREAFVNTKCCHQIDPRAIFNEYAQPTPR